MVEWRAWSVAKDRTMEKPVIVDSADIYRSNWGSTSLEDADNKVPGPVDIIDYWLQHPNDE